MNQSGMVIDPDDLISVARIARPQGHRGEVIADLLTDFPDRFARLNTVTVKGSSGQSLSLRLENSRLHKGRIVLKFAGYDDMNRAEELRDSLVMIPRNQLVTLPEDSYYNFDLVDCDVRTASGESLGKVIEVQDYGAAPLLVVVNDDREFLIPLASSICVEIDTMNKRIIVEPPDGLFDL
ncbi:MAG: ribosome maturation factor RimM [Blastocatellales bacterium]